jgi:hypothetical protein
MYANVPKLIKHIKIRYTPLLKTNIAIEHGPSKSGFTH